jgi:uncharacterized protein YjbI with pentapeptide repeats
LTAAERARAESDFRGHLITALGGLVLAAGAYFTGRTFALNREGQITERFTRGVEQLANKEQLDIRLGGIYALERIAWDSETHYEPVMELTAFLREHARWKDDGAASAARAPGQPLKVPELRADFQAAATVLGRRNVTLERKASRSDEGEPYHLILRGVDLRGAKLRRAILRDVRFENAHLELADLRGASLEDAHLQRTHLQGARLDSSLTRLDRAQMQGAQLQEARLTWAHLEDAHLSPREDEAEAAFFESDLEGADLRWAHLEGANLFRAHLKRANLSHAHLRRAKLDGADLSGADLSGANLSAAEITMANLSEAKLVRVCPTPT